jgi:hypothetical protein
MLNKLNINILGYIHNNILNMQDKFDDSFFISNDITLLGTFLFDKKIYNFDCEYNSDVSNAISKIIYIKTK